MTHMLKQLLETHPAEQYHKDNRTEQTEYSFNGGNAEDIDDIFGKVGIATKPFPDSVEKVRWDDPFSRHLMCEYVTDSLSAPLKSPWQFRD